MTESRPSARQATHRHAANGHAAHRRVPRRLSVRLRALASLGLVLGLGGVATMAAWTDDATATATFSTGTIDITANGASSTVFTSLGMSLMKPGSSVAASLPIGNAGTLPLRYSLSSATAATTALSPTDLGAALTVSIYPGGTASNAAGTGSCTGTALVTAAPLAGTLIAPGSARTLAAGASETLCFVVALPAAAANLYQGTGTTASLTFSGTSF